MYARTATFAFTLVALALTGRAAHDPATTGALATPANRIVGLWSTQGAVGPCNSGSTPIQVRNYLLFHAGGTVTENIPPLTTRNTGLGTWSYDPATGWYTLHLRFDRFASGVYSGYSTVDRQLLMTPDGLQISGPVRAIHYAPDGTVVSELCGEAVSQRLS